MKRIITIGLIALCFSACSSHGANAGSAQQNGATRLTDEEKHRLYSAALAAKRIAARDGYILRKCAGRLESVTPMANPMIGTRCSSASMSIGQLSLNR